MSCPPSKSLPPRSKQEARLSSRSRWYGSDKNTTTTNATRRSTETDMNSTELINKSITVADMLVEEYRALYSEPELVFAKAVARMAFLEGYAKGLSENINNKTQKDNG